MEMTSSKGRVITVLATDALSFVMRIRDTRCMKFRTSFRGKLLLLTILPLAAAQIVTLFAVMRTVEEDVDRRARESLVIGGAVVNEFLAGRSEQLRANVEILAADFRLKRAVETGNVDIIQSVLSNHSQRVGADIALVLDPISRAPGGRRLVVGPTFCGSYKTCVKNRPRNRPQHSTEKPTTRLPYLFGHLLPSPGLCSDFESIQNSHNAWADSPALKYHS
jgi:hypothetical protein